MHYFLAGRTYESFWNPHHTMTVHRRTEKTLVVSWGQDTLTHEVDVAAVQIDPRGTVAEVVIDEGERYYSDLEVA